MGAFTMIHRGVDRSTKGDDPVDDLLGGLQHDDLLARGEADDRVGSRLDVLDEVGVENQWQMVQPCDFYHNFVLDAPKAISMKSGHLLLSFEDVLPNARDRFRR